MALGFSEGLFGQEGLGKGLQFSPDTTILKMDMANQAAQAKAAAKQQQEGDAWEKFAYDHIKLPDNLPPALVDSEKQKFAQTLKDADYYHNLPNGQGHQKAFDILTDYAARTKELSNIGANYKENEDIKSKGAGSLTPNQADAWAKVADPTPTDLEGYKARTTSDPTGQYIGGGGVMKMIDQGTGNTTDELKKQFSTANTTEQIGSQVRPIAGNEYDFSKYTGILKTDADAEKMRQQSAVDMGQAPDLATAAKNKSLGVQFSSGTSIGTQAAKDPKFRNMWVNENRDDIVNKDGSINADYQGVQSDGKGGLVKTGKFDINSDAITNGIIKQAEKQAPMKQTIVTGKYPTDKNNDEGIVRNGQRNPFTVAGDGSVSINYSPKNGDSKEFTAQQWEVPDGDVIQANGGKYVPTFKTGSPISISSDGKTLSIGNYDNKTNTYKDVTQVSLDKGTLQSGIHNDARLRGVIGNSVYDTWMKEAKEAAEKGNGGTAAKTPTPVDWNTQWSKLKSGETLVGLDGKTYTKK